ncbi:MAG: hypothetical protein A49_14460 [Methyloceanibacter sp.]|nr:MAG: hypothetical protein A49_14460 [Methyloceanibacter sp.]
MTDELIDRLALGMSAHFIVLLVGHFSRHAVELRGECGHGVGVGSPGFDIVENLFERLGGFAVERPMFALAAFANADGIDDDEASLARSIRRVGRDAPQRVRRP